MARRRVHQSAGARSTDKPGVRALLAAEIGTRAAEGHIGPVNRWFAGTRHIDEVEALCVELLKRLFRCNYADHRMCASMTGNAVVYTALSQPGDVIMSAAQPFGGHSSNRIDGPAGAMGRKVVDIPFDPHELVVDLDLFRRAAPLVQPKLVALGLSMTLFPQPVAAMKQAIADWGGRLFFDAAHQLGLIGGNQFQDPLKEGADIMTGSAGKTFSGPQSGIIVWDDPEITSRDDRSVSGLGRNPPGQSRRGAGARDRRGARVRRRIAGADRRNSSRARAAALHARGIPMLGSHKGFTTTHQAIADVREYGRGLKAAQTLERANIIVNKNLLPADRKEDWDFPGGLRIGTIEVTRFGMKEKEMEAIADMIARVVVRNENPENVRAEAVALRRSFPTLYYCFENGMPG